MCGGWGGGQGQHSLLVDLEADECAGMYLYQEELK